MWHTLFIAAHAAAGAIALLTGCVAITGRALFGIYLWSLVAMEVFLALAVAAEWTVIDTASRVLFTAFVGLGLFMLWRAGQARRLRPRAAERLSPSYVEHIGFTLVALFDAFIVIVVLNAGGPIWLIVTAGVAIAVAGHFVLRAMHRRLDHTGVSPASAR